MPWIYSITTEEKSSHDPKEHTREARLNGSEKAQGHRGARHGIPRAPEKNTNGQAEPNGL